MTQPASMSAIPADRRIASPWRRALPAVLLLWAAVLLLYRDTAIAMVEIWQRSSTFTHAYLVLPISLWLVWRQRAQLAQLTPRPQPWMLLPMAAVAALWLVADLVTVNAASQFALVALLVLAVPAMLGLQVAKAILFPLMFLFFAVPFGEFLLPTMIERTADFAVSALRLSGIPVYREGNQFVIPTGKWSVVEACSGVRYLIASFMVGTLFAYLNYRSTTRRIVFMAISIVVPVVANWLRAYMIVMLGHYSGNTIAVGVDHLIYGWIFFGVVIMIMFLIGVRWSEPEAALSAAPAPPAIAGASRGTGVAWAGAWVASVAVVLLPQLAAAHLNRADAGAAAPQFALPGRLGDWQAAPGQIVSWQPSFVNPSVEAVQAYASGGRTVGVYVAYYRGQGPQRKLVSSENVLVASQDRQWNQVASGRHELNVGGRELSVRTAELLGEAPPGAEKRPHLVVWRSYWVGETWVASDAAAKLMGALARLRGRGDDGALIVMYADGESTAASTAALEAFAAANLGELERLLQQARDAR